ncbi:MAG TPA: hypothetical protein ENH02_00425, partial [Bacteroidetes bacterium]|nr:hypothetical protein [Bacteroidota bacterium]
MDRILDFIILYFHSTMRVRIVFLMVLIFIFSNAYPQKEANVWYFGSYSGLDFNGGEPEVLDGMFSSLGSCSTMSDSDGNFLFTTNGEKIWNRDKQIMMNGSGLKGDDRSSQGVLILQKPGSENLYYVFTTAFADGNLADFGLYYSIVDMNLDNGLGGVTSDKNVLLLDAWDAAEKIVACKQENSENIWVITRKFYNDGYAAFLLTSEGVNTNAVFSPSIDRPYDLVGGNMKISPDKKHLVAAYSTDQPATNTKPDFEICNFNVQTGEIILLYTVRHGTPGTYGEPDGVEFSPDSKLLYLSVFDEPNGVTKLFQYDMQYYEDSTQFVKSKINIATGPANGLQLATDGKIYTSSDYILYYPFISVINKPWKRGLACYFEADAIDLSPGKVGAFLPNILLDYLYRFEWQGRCQSEPFQFQSNFQPVPTLISWDFGDPGSG